MTERLHPVGRIHGGPHAFVRENVETGALRPEVGYHLKEGDSIPPGAEVVSAHRDHLDGPFEIRDSYTVPDPLGRAGGPAKVTSEAFRAGWDACFSKGAAN